MATRQQHKRLANNEAHQKQKQKQNGNEHRTADERERSSRARGRREKEEERREAIYAVVYVFDLTVLLRCVAGARRVWAHNL
jgi:hypothetical protein